jgi:hypothetical protein
MPFAPFLQCFENRAEFAALCRDDVFRAGWVFGVKASLDYSVLLKRLQSCRQGIRADSAERAFEVLELSRPIQYEISKNQERPAFADHLKRPCNRAIFVRTSRHRFEPSVALCPETDVLHIAARPGKLNMVSTEFKVTFNFR